MEKSKLLIIALAVMVVLNLGLMSFMFFKTKNRHHRKHLDNCKKEWKNEGEAAYHSSGEGKWRNHEKERRPRMRKGMLPEKIGFTEKQKMEFDMLMTNHIDTMESVREKENQTRKELMSLLKTEPINTEAKDSLLMVISKNKTEMSALFFDHFSSIRAMCTSDQKVKFDSMMSKMDDRMMHHPPR